MYIYNHACMNVCTVEPVYSNHAHMGHKIFGLIREVAALN